MPTLKRKPNPRRACWMAALILALPQNAFATTTTTPAMPGRTEMNCSDPRGGTDAALSPAEEQTIAQALARIYAARIAKHKGFHRDSIDDYMLYDCAIIKAGHRYIAIDGLYRFMGAILCDDAVDFVVAYDPRSRTFGDISFETASCPPDPDKKT